ncbi:MAG: mannonate dehydratase [Acidobacteria bacterium]|nr:mannonate dehydratase [Acidobacteriota bacterium]
MKRREFNGTLVGGLASTGIAAPASAATALAQAARVPRKNTLMHVGGDYHSVVGGRGADITGKPNLEYNLRHGVKHLTAQVRKMSEDGAWDPDELKRMRDNCDRHGVIFEAIRMDDEYIRLRKGPARDRRLENVAGNIRKASEIGVKVITYHWRVIPIRRNRRVAGRGGVTYNGFKLEDNWRDLPLEESGVVTSDDYWERITYFLERVIPVAREYDVRMACHPYDPPGLPFGYQGAENWDSPSVFEAIKRYESVVDSPYNGFQLCLGTTGEGLKNPNTEILPIVEYLGERGKIYQIHMRNIRGGLNDFLEVFPDEGDMDFLKIMRILRDTQFSGAFCPDHMPRHADDPERLQAFAFGYGYIKALIQVVNSEV